MKSLGIVKYIAFLVAFTICGWTHDALAQEMAPEGLLPTGTTVSVESTLMDEETHPPLRLTPDKSEILTVDDDVKRVIIGSTPHLNILLDSPRRLVLIPRAPGATHFTLLGADGKVIMQRHAIIASPKEHYVRVRRPCRDPNECMPVRVYYCPGMCHEIGVAGEGNVTFSGSMPMRGGGAGIGNDIPPEGEDAEGEDTGGEGTTEGQ